MRPVAMALAGVAFAVVATDQTAQEKAADTLETLADAASDPEASLPPARAAGVAAACKLFNRYDNDIRNRWERPERLWRRLDAMPWRSLPARASCGGLATAFHSAEYGTHITAVAQSADGRFVGLRGGIQLAPLAGQGSDCLYARNGQGFRLIACARTWVS